MNTNMLAILIASVILGIKNNPSKGYTLKYLKSFDGAERKYGVGERHVRHDVSLKKWRLTIQLDEQRLWFLSVFIRDDGTFDKFSLDEESAYDSHYEFTDEKAIRKKLYRRGDEKRLLDEIFIRYVAENGGPALLRAIYPFVTAQFHYD